MPESVGYAVLDISSFRERSQAIARLLANNGIGNEILTHLALVHVIVSAWINEGLSEESMTVNLSSLLAAARELAGAHLPEELRTKRSYLVASKN